jgi:hypothetical protein
MINPGSFHFTFNSWVKTWRDFVVSIESPDLYHVPSNATGTPAAVPHYNVGAG